MAKCENCYHAEICKNYPNTGLPQKMRNELLDKGKDGRYARSVKGVTNDQRRTSLLQKHQERT